MEYSDVAGFQTEPFGFLSYQQLSLSKVLSTCYSLPGHKLAIDILV